MSLTGVNSYSAAITANVLKAQSLPQAAGAHAASGSYLDRVAAALKDQTGGTAKTAEGGSSSSSTASVASMLSMLNSLADPQPTLFDYMNDDTSTPGSDLSLLSALDGSSLDNDLLGFLTDSGTDATSADPLLSLASLGASGSGMSPNVLSALAKYSSGGSNSLLDMLEQAYGQAAPADTGNATIGQLVNSLT